MDIFVDYYEILGVAQDADMEKVREAYLHKKERAAIENWKASRLTVLETAHAVLSQSVRRQEYDKQRACIDTTPETVPIETDKNTLFNMRVKSMMQDAVPHGSRRGKDVRREVILTLSEVFTGGKKPVQFSVKYPCKVCAMRCAFCKGTGNMFIQKKLAPGFNQRSSIDCYSCLGKGHTFRKDPQCVMCKGEGSYDQQRQCILNVPPGVDHGHEILLRGYGEQILNGDNGNLIFVLKTNTMDPLVRRDKCHLQVTLPIPWIKTLTGIKYNLNLPCGVVEVDTRDFREIIQPNKWYIVPNKGLPVYNPKTKTIEAYGHVGVQFLVIYDIVNKSIWEREDELHKIEKQLAAMLMEKSVDIAQKHPTVVNEDG